MIWQICDGNNQFTRISGTLYRLVESQEQIATMGYVDTLDEQVLLEEMLESAKPDYPDGINDYHYLLTTPFRYPPLEHGSRFGHINETSLFYAGCDPRVALAETAFYRFIFLHSIDGVTIDDKMRSEHSMFNVNYQTDKGVTLQHVPFTQFQAELTHPSNYLHTQQLGRDMREAGVMGFEYQSARDANNGTCVGLYNTSPFSNNKPDNIEPWLCETSLNVAQFKAIDQNSVYQYSIEDFMVDGTLPLPV